MKVVLALVTLLCVWCTANADCVMRGVCAEINGFLQNCPSSGEAPKLTEGADPEDAAEAIAILQRACPPLLQDEDGVRLPDNEVRTCCDTEQVLNMASGVLMAESVLGRCPTCFKNFMRQICEMNCSPEQARFVDVYIDNTTAPDGRPYVNEIDYRLHNDFMVGAHASCAGVIVPQTGAPAINLMCGSAAVCDADAWFGFSGDTQDNPLAPTQVNFIRVQTVEDSMNARALPCNETNDGDIPCACMDCMTTCPSGLEPLIPEVCTVMGLHCAGFSVSIIIVILTVVVLAVLTKCERRVKKQDIKPPLKPRKDNCNHINRGVQIILSKIGVFSASNPQLVIMLTSWLLLFMLYGISNLNITSDPVELWSKPDSRSRYELNYFNSRFGPFYRAAQVFLQVKLDPFTVNNETFGPAYRLEALEELVKLEDAILDIGINGGVTLEQVCFAPLRLPGAEQHIDECVAMSASVYLGADRNNINNATYLNRIQNCLNNYLSLNCMAPFGGGADPELAIGGFTDDILAADTLLINYPINNYLYQDQLEPVLEWELKFIELLKDYEANWKSDFIDVSFGTERSIEDEIIRVSVAEAIPISISYILMFIYVTISLGNVRSCSTWIIESKVMVAVGSIIVVLISIICAMGMMAYTGVTTTLLAINVIPFFILSIGIDNVFLMVNTLHDIQTKLKSYDDYNENLSFEKRRRFVFRKMMERVGPSMFVASVTQITCFSIGILANFPAVVTFAIFATYSMMFLFIFQITTVVAILSLDYKRASQNRFDILCCIQKKLVNDSDPLNSEVPYESVSAKLLKPYSKFILKKVVRIAVIVIFTLTLCISIVMIPQLEIGLDQELALPKDSYVYKYLQSVNNLLVLGAPVYFVLKGGLNFTNPEDQNAVCGGQLCNTDSLTTQIFLASQYGNVTYIARSSNSWIDDFFDWSSLFGACCKYNTTDGGFCSSIDNSVECAYCSIDRGEWQNGLRPAGEAFEHYLPFFLRDAPTEVCNKGGLASYFSHVNYVLDSEGKATVGDSNFMAYHSSLGTSYDYITAIKYAYEISDNITAAIKLNTGKDVEVFPYSKFYVFYEQYLTMWADTFASIGYCLIGAFLLNLIASGFNFMSTFAVILTAIMVVINMMGVMYIWNIPLNPVSCVNLIVAIGVAVEFCSHMAYAFTTSESPKEERVADALRTIGPTIITGITLTNLPIIVLAFSYTEIIEVFFFRMFFSLVIIGFLHGMVFFPVLLSYISSLRKS